MFDSEKMYSYEPESARGINIILKANGMLWLE